MQVFCFKITGSKKQERFRNVIKNTLNLPDYLDAKSCWIASHHWHSKFNSFPKRISTPHAIKDAIRLNIIKKEKFFVDKGVTKYFASPDYKEKCVRDALPN